MNKLSKIALLVSTAISAQAFAAEAGKVDVEVYGKVGATTQFDADKSASLDSRTDEDFKAYQDSKLGVKLGYGITKNFSVHSELKADYEGKDIELRVQELLIKAEVGKFDAELGRFRTPLYMNSVHQDDDLSLHTYRGVRGFSTQGESILAPLETVDGISIGFNNEIEFGAAEVRGFIGQAKSRDFAIWDSSSKETIATDIDSENIWGLETSLDSDFGKFRAAYLSAEIEDTDFDSTSLGYKFKKDQYFVDAEIAREKYKNENTDSVVAKKGYVTLGMEVSDFTPSITYSQTDFDTSIDQDVKSFELGFAYDVNQKIRLKSAYEYVEVGSNFDDSIVSVGAAFKF